MMKHILAATFVIFLSACAATPETQMQQCMHCRAHCKKCKSSECKCCMKKGDKASHEECKICMESERASSAR